MAAHETQGLSVGEFTRRMEAFENTVVTGQNRIELKVDGHSERIAVLEEAHRTGRNKHVAKTAGWSTLAAGTVTLLIKVIEAVASNAPHVAK